MATSSEICRIVVGTETLDSDACVVCLRASDPGDHYQRCTGATATSRSACRLVCDMLIHGSDPAASNLLG